MKPVLIVEGVQYDVVSISWYGDSINSVMVRDSNNNLVTYYDEITNMYVEEPLKINIAKSLIWNNRYQPVIDRLQKKIDGIEENQVDLAVQYIENDVTTNETFDIREKYIRNGILLDGLYETVGLIDEMVNGDEDE